MGLGRFCTSVSPCLWGHSILHELLRCDCIQSVSRHIQTRGTIGLWVEQDWCHKVLAKALLPLSLVVETFIVIVQLKERWMRWSEFTVHYALCENEEKK